MLNSASTSGFPKLSDLRDGRGWPRSACSERRTSRLPYARARRWPRLTLLRMVQQF